MHDTSWGTRRVDSSLQGKVSMKNVLVPLGHNLQDDEPHFGHPLSWHGICTRENTKGSSSHSQSKGYKEE